MCFITLSFFGVIAHAGLDDLAFSIKANGSNFNANQKVEVELTVENTGSEAVGLLDWKFPKGAGEWEEDLFEITRDGLAVKYKGMHVKRPASNKSNYRFLKPGKKVKLKAVLSDAYDFSETGYYTLRYKVRGFSLAMDAKGKKSMRVDQYTSVAVNAYIEGRKFKRPDSGDSAGGGDKPCKGKNCPPPTDGFYSCTDEQKAIITEAEAAASDIANGSYDYLRRASNDSERYAHWFGAYDGQRWNIVETGFQAIANALDNEAMEYDCKCKSNYYAHVYPDEPYRVYFCKVFWTAPMNGEDSKAGVIVHEVSHFNVVAGTDDIVYGQDGAAELADTSPDDAINNADNFEYFAENTPAIP